MKTSIPAAFLAAVVLAAQLSPAGATIYCDIRGTADGFVALRSGPSARFRMIERMRPGDEVLVGLRKVGKWIDVTFWRGGRFATGKHETGDPHTARGWMHEDFVAEDSCG
jgi:hypothetical protein